MIAYEGRGDEVTLKSSVGFSLRIWPVWFLNGPFEILPVAHKVKNLKC